MGWWIVQETTKKNSLTSSRVKSAQTIFSIYDSNSIFSSDEFVSPSVKDFHFVGVPGPSASESVPGSLTTGCKGMTKRTRPDQKNLPTYIPSWYYQP